MFSIGSWTQLADRMAAWLSDVARSNAAGGRGGAGRHAAAARRCGRSCRGFGGKGPKRWAANYWRSMHGAKESARLRSLGVAGPASGLRHENVRLRSRVEELSGANRRLTKERFGRHRTGRGRGSIAERRRARRRARRRTGARRVALAVESETVEPTGCCGRAYVANGAKTGADRGGGARARAPRASGSAAAACACAPGRERWRRGAACSRTRRTG